mmetsp:Transcript_31729/g.52991  ORF Transcript_31729/g.52991 Transcript_31729/m.52991 type:complete len:234 (+) Transcript_31729:1234-1935(+)
MFIGIYKLHSLSCFDFNRCHLCVKNTLLFGCCPCLLTSQGVGITFLPCNSILFSQVFSGHTHRSLGIGIGKSIPEGVAHLQTSSKFDPPSSIVTCHRERSITHVFGSSTNCNFGFSQLDRMGTENDSLKARATQTIDGQTRRGQFHATAQTYVSCQIGGIGTGLNHVSKEYTVHSLWIQIDGVQRRLGGMRSKIGGRQGFQRSTKRSKGSTLCGNEKDSRHDVAVDDENDSLA